MKHSLTLPSTLALLSLTVSQSPILYAADYFGVPLPAEPIVRINGQENGAVVTRTEAVSIDFLARDKQNEPVDLDWWILAGSEALGWFWYEKEANRYVREVSLASQEILFNQGQRFTLPELSGLAVGHYQVYFGADTQVNGNLDSQQLGYSQIQLQVVNQKSQRFSYQSDFSQGLDGWEGNFVDIPVDYDPEIYELSYEYAEMPTEVSETYTHAPVLQGHNRSDDLFMYMTRPITGLKHHTQYRVTFNVEIASNAMAGGFGIGGAPGESVYFKAGVATEKPQAVISDGNDYRLNVDKGNQSQSGKDAIVLGHIGVDILDSEYQLKGLNNQNNTFEFSTAQTDEVWLLLGTDSGFEGLTRIYIPSVNVVIEEIGPADTENDELTITLL